MANEKSAVKRSNTSLKDLSKVLEDHGRHSMLSFLSSLPISVVRTLDTEANKFYDRNHQLYDAALLTRCYTQHALQNSELPIICYKHNKPIRNTVFNFSKLVSDLDIHANNPES